MAAKIDVHKGIELRTQGTVPKLITFLAERREPSGGATGELALFRFDRNREVISGQFLFNWST